MTIYQQLKIILISSVLLLNNTIILSEISENDLWNDIIFDEEDIDEGDMYDNYLDTITADRVINTFDPAKIMIIANLFGIPEIVQSSLFFHTNPLNQKNILDQPIFEPTRPFYKDKMIIGFDGFIRKKDRSNFTKNHTKIASYIALTEKTLLEKLQNVAEQISQFAPENPLDIEKMFKLFENMTVEERQIGFMAHVIKQWHKTTLRVMAPVYYTENNFSLTKREQDAVAQEFGVMEPEEEKLFRKAHFICDKIGVGDTRIELDQRIIKIPFLTVRAGIQATIPTAFTWGTGFMGSSYPKPSTLPTFDLEPIFDSFEQATAAAEQAAIDGLSSLLLDSFDRIAANLIDTKLGNNRHMGLGFFLRTKNPLKSYFNNSFAENISFTNRLSAEFFLPSTETRFYTNQINQQEFVSRNFQDLSQAVDNLQFLEEQIIERLFLQALPTRVIPGGIFRWTNSLMYTHQKIGFNIGTDFWMQARDISNKIYSSQATAAKVDLTKSIPPFAAQWKLVTGIVFKNKKPRSFYFISLNGDATFSNKGLGQDYGISLNFEANF